MSDTKFTPGPWFVVNSTDVFTGLGAKNNQGIKADHDDGFQIADCNVYGAFVDGIICQPEAQEQIANANLIASAPELYEALVLLEAEMVLSGNAGSEDYGWKPAIEKTRKALAKARGES